MQHERPSFWFPVKTYGWGWGLPVRWQGWLVLITYLAIVWGSIALFDDDKLVLVSIIAPATLVFALVAIRTTRGGFRWRWGGRE